MAKHTAREDLTMRLVGVPVSFASNADRVSFKSQLTMCLSLALDTLFSTDRV